MPQTCPISSPSVRRYSILQQLKSNRAGRFPVITAISVLHSHILFTETEGGNSRKPLNPPRCLMKFAEVSKSLNAGELKASVRAAEPEEGAVESSLSQAQEDERASRSSARV